MWFEQANCWGSIQNANQYVNGSEHFRRKQTLGIDAGLGYFNFQPGTVAWFCL